MPQPLPALLVYGPLGIMVIIVCVVAVKLYMDLKEERKEHAKTQLMWQERYITKAETWMTKFQELSESIGEVLESLERRYDRR